MSLSLAFSPCPNDTFIFDALVNKKIPSDSLSFDVNVNDVENLNKSALNGKYDITKLSFNAYQAVSDQYKILSAGVAVGKHNGPLLISKKNIKLSELKNLRIAIPGKMTTANLLFTIAFPEVTNKTEVLFSDIEALILNDEFDAGLIIHETRFTYAEKGLKKIVDLGEFWESNYNKYLPLGCIAVKRKIQTDIQLKINELIRSSIIFSNMQLPVISSYIKENAKELSESVIRKHIDLYVNDLSLNIGEKGKDSIEFLFKKAFEFGLCSKMPSDCFVQL